MAHIRARFSTTHETYGVPRMHVELKEDGLQVGRHRVARLMRENGLKALQKRRYKKTTDSSHGGPVAANLLDQDFGCDGPDQKWGADISYIWTAEGWLYGAFSGVVRFCNKPQHIGVAHCISGCLFASCM